MKRLTARRRCDINQRLNFIGTDAWEHGAIGPFLLGVLVYHARWFVIAFLLAAGVGPWIDTVREDRRFHDDTVRPDSTRASARPAVRQLSEFPHQIELSATTGEAVVFAYEIIHNPDAPLFYRIIRIEVGPRNRQYYLDEGDDNIKVFDSNNEYLFTFGGRGQAPGEWQSATVFSVGPNGLVYVWDATARLFHVFDNDGRFLHRIYYADGRFQPEAFVWIDDDEVLAGGLSLNLGYFGYFIHRMRVESDGDRLLLARVDSFAETGEFAPGLYLDVAGGLLARDIDGGLLFSSRAGHRIDKYQLDGTLLWRISDPGILPPAAEYFDDLCVLASVEASEEVGRRAELAWNRARVVKWNIAGYVIPMVLEVPPSVPRVDAVPGWVMYVAAQCQARQGNKITVAEEGGF